MNPGENPGYRVVVADDVADLRFLVRKVLERSGRFTVVGEARDGREAVDVAQEHQPDLTLLDLSMPVMDGLEALPLIRAAVPDCTVVVLSGFDADRMAAQAMTAGAAAYLVKGTEPQTLVERLLELLQGRDEAAPASGGSDGPGDAMLHLPAELQSARRARDFIRDTLERWARTSSLDEAVLLATELVSNAVVHAKSEVDLCLQRFDERIRIEVTDHGGGALEFREADQEALGGRGLLLVQELSLAWGTSADGDAKVVWFEL